MPTVEPVAPVIPEIPVVPTEDPVVSVMPAVEPVAPVIPEIPAVPTVDPVVPVMPTVEPVQTAAPSIFESVPTITPIVEPVTNIAPMPTTPIVEESLPSKFLETVEVPAVEPTTPVVEEKPEVNELAEAEAKLDAKTDEISPIIITDYSKQYDPVIPNAEPAPERVDFKQIINLIRDVNSTIEKCGYSIETEEYDLEGIYQVIFKINKN